MTMQAAEMISRNFQFSTSYLVTLIISLVTFSLASMFYLYENSGKSLKNASMHRKQTEPKNSDGFEIFHEAGTEPKS